MKKNLLDCISVCDSLLKHMENVPFLKQTVMSNEKWILDNNVELKRLWGIWNESPPTTPKAFFIQRRSCVYGGVGRESSNMSSFWKTKWLVPSESSTSQKAYRISKILLMEKYSVPWKTSKGTWNRPLLKKIKSFGKMKLGSCLEDDRR